ncbi:MAG: hypothetical protein ACLFSE_03590 [Spirochaetia bacterium]
MKKIIIYILMFSAALTAAAQEGTPDLPGSPEEPSIVLPEMFLEIEDLSAEKLDAVLPPGEELEVPDTAIPLPELDPMAVSDDTFLIPLPSITGETGTVTSGESSFYSTGLIGIGTMNNIIGSVSLYKLGDEPRFTFQFSHESVDGYDFNPAGTGFFRKTDDLSGWLSLRSGSVQLRGEGSYREDEEGLQQQAPYYAAALKQSTGQLSFSIDPVTSPLFFNSNFTVLSGKRMLTSATADTAPVNHREIKIGGSLVGGADFSSLALHLSTRYSYRFLPGYPDLQSHRVFVETGFDAALRDVVVFDGNAGFAYTDSLGSLFPFGLSVSLILKDSLVLSVGGGYRVVPQDYTALWNDYRLLELQTTLIDGTEWYGSAGMKIQNRIRSLYLEGLLGFSYREGVIELNGYEPQQGAYPFVQRNLTTLFPKVILNYLPGDLFNFSIGWEGVLLERTVQEDAHRFLWEAGMNSRDGRFGAGFTGWSALNNWRFELPVLDFSAFFKATEGVEFILEADDILSPVQEDGRTTIAPFIAPGFRMTFKTQISL